MHWLVFNRAWFTQHQSVLIWLLNCRLTRRWFRYVLRIRSFDCGIRERIIRLMPNHYIVVLPDGRFRADFRTHAKYSKRLYYAFKPMWWALHYWDALFADRLIPRLSFSYAPLTVYPDPHTETTSVDGHTARHGVDETWATIIAGAGTFGSDSGTDIVLQIIASTTLNQWERFYRVAILFDTSSLTGSATINSATLSVYGNFKDDNLSATPDANVYTSSPASDTAVASGDHGSYGSTPQCDTAVTYTNWTITGYNDFALNSTGRGNISKTGISKFGLRNAKHDVAASAPNWVSNVGSQIRAWSADKTGTSNDPKLVITYDAGPAGFAYSQAHIIG